MSWFKDLIHKLSNYDKLKLQLDNTIQNKKESEALLTEQLAIAYEEIEEVRDSLEIAKQPVDDRTELEVYCDDKDYKLERIAYQNKRSFKGESITIFLHELIQPNGYEIYDFARKIKSYGVKAVGNAVAKHLTWTDDKQFNPSTKDYYCTPSDSLVFKNVDCEDHSYVCASLMPKTLGVAYGFINLPTGESFGHSFNVYVKDGDLWLLDTVENTAIIKKVEKHYYSINYIVTQKGVYIVDDSVNFGMKAR